MVLIYRSNAVFMKRDNPRMVWVGRSLKNHLASTPDMGLKLDDWTKWTAECLATQGILKVLDSMIVDLLWSSRICWEQVASTWPQTKGKKMGRCGTQQGKGHPCRAALSQEQQCPPFNGLPGAAAAEDHGSYTAACCSAIPLCSKTMLGISPGLAGHVWSGNRQEALQLWPPCVDWGHNEDSVHPRYNRSGQSLIQLCDSCTKQLKFSARTISVNLLDLKETGGGLADVQKWDGFTEILEVMDAGIVNQEKLDTFHTTPLIEPVPLQKHLWWFHSWYYVWNST